MSTPMIRLIASPPIAPHTLDVIASALGAHGDVLTAGNDADVNASAVTASIAGDRLGRGVAAVGERMTVDLAAGRAFRIELMGTPGELPAEEAVRSMAVGLHGAFSAPVYIARRDAPAAAWALARPMPWGRKGLAVGQSAPTLPFGGSDCLGVAIEIGAPTVILKARLEAVPEHGLIRACAAVGGAESGFAEVGAYPGVSPADGASVVILEFGDVARTPIARVLGVLDIEAARFGGRLGQTALLSHVPLDALLEVLRSRTGLDASRAHVLETHLPGDAAT